MYGSLRYRHWLGYPLSIPSTVWKLILPIGTKSSKFGKWSPNWEGPYRVNQSAPGNVYILETLEGVEFPRALNRKYLKKYYPSIWVDA